TSSSVSAFRVLNLHHQASPVSRTPSMPAVDTSYIPPVPPLIQDYRPYYHTPNDLSELNFFSFLQGDNHQHYNMVMAAAAAASDDHELLLNRFLPYSTSSSSSSQLFLDQSGASSVTSLTAPTNGASNSGSTSSLVSSSSLRDTHSTHSSSHSSHAHPGVVASRSSTEAAVAAIYGGIPDVISLD
ncbi:E3 SUMO-protein ligase PIAS1, partial [Nibea albiflora]